MKFSRLVIPEAKAASLTWCGDALVDWVSGGNVFHLDGRRKEPRISWGFPFDAACATEDGEYAVIYQRTGTKGLLLREGKIVRELNRSYYHAHAGETVTQWEDLDTGTQVSSIIWNTNLPPLAIDVKRHRFAVAGSDNITVVQADLPDSL